MFSIQQKKRGTMTSQQLRYKQNTNSIVKKKFKYTIYALH